MPFGRRDRLNVFSRIRRTRPSRFATDPQNKLYKLNRVSKVRRIK